MRNRMNRSKSLKSNDSNDDNEDDSPLVTRSQSAKLRDKNDESIIDFERKRSLSNSNEAQIATNGQKPLDALKKEQTSAPYQELDASSPIGNNSQQHTTEWNLHDDRRSLSFIKTAPQKR